MKRNTNTKMNSLALGASGILVSSVFIKGEVLAYNSHSFNPIILPYFIRL